MNLSDDKGEILRSIFASTRYAAHHVLEYITVWTICLLTWREDAVLDSKNDIPSLELETVEDSSMVGGDSSQHCATFLSLYLYISKTCVKSKRH